MGLLRELVPTAALIGVLLNPNNANMESQRNDVQEAARTVGQQIHILYAATQLNLDEAFATLSRLRAGALLVAADPFFNSRRDQFALMAARHAIPAIY